MPRETGYRIKIDAFVPAAPDDIDRLGQVAAAIKRARAENEVADILGLAVIEDVQIKSQTRNVPALPPSNASAPIPLTKPEKKDAA